MSNMYTLEMTDKALLKHLYDHGRETFVKDSKPDMELYNKWHSIIDGLAYSKRVLNYTRDYNHYYEAISIELTIPQRELMQLQENYRQLVHKGETNAED